MFALILYVVMHVNSRCTIFQLDVLMCVCAYMCISLYYARKHKILERFGALTYWLECLMFVTVLVLFFNALSALEVS